MEIKNKYLDSFTWCFWTIFLGLYAVALFTPIIEFELFSLIFNFALLIIFACLRIRIKDITSLEIVVVGIAFFHVGKYI